MLSRGSLVAALVTVALVSIGCSAGSEGDDGAVAVSSTTSTTDAGGDAAASGGATRAASRAEANANLPPAVGTYYTDPSYSGYGMGKDCHDALLHGMRFTGFEIPKRSYTFVGYVVLDSDNPWGLAVPAIVGPDGHPQASDGERVEFDWATIYGEVERCAMNLRRISDG